MKNYKIKHSIFSWRYFIIEQSGLIKYVPLSTFCATPFYVPCCSFHHSFKEKCPLSGAKTQIKYVNPGTILLRRYRYILLCFYYVATETYCGYKGIKVNALSCPTPNPTLNLADSVNKFKTDIKMYLFMQPCHFNFLTCRFELLCRTVITWESNRSSSLYSVSCWTNLPSIDTRLDMCDANIQKHQF